MQSSDVGHNNENGPRSRKIKYVSLSYILFGLSQISSKAFCQKKLFASLLSTPSAVVTVRLGMCQMCTILSSTNYDEAASNMFHCPIFSLVFPRSRQKPFVRRSSLQAHFLLLLLLSLACWCWHYLF